MTRPRRGLWLGVVCLAVVALMAILVPSAPLAIERAWFEQMQDIRAPALTHVALVFNALGRGLWRALSLGAIAVVLALARRWLALIAFALVEGLTPLTSAILKGVVDRPRPPGGLVHPVGASFPSGHAAYGGATFVGLVLVFTSPGPRRALWWALAALGIAAMAASRTYLQVHWLADVIAGSLLGVGVALTVFAAAQELAARRARAEPSTPVRD